MSLSIELCTTTGHEAASILGIKVRDEALPVSIGGEVLRSIKNIKHSGDGLLVVTYAGDEPEGSEVFQFSPDNRPFSRSAVDSDGAPVCEGCE